MKKPLTITIGVLALLTAASEAQAVQHRFIGGAVITGKSGTCPDYDPTGDRFHVRFRPSGLGTNGSNSGLSLFQLEGAINFRVSGRFNTTAKLATTTYIYSFGDVNPNAVTVKFTSQVPTTLDTTTQYINAAGVITGYDYMPLCTVTFTMSVTKRPE